MLIVLIALVLLLLYAAASKLRLFDDQEKLEAREQAFCIFAGESGSIKPLDLCDDVVQLHAAKHGIKHFIHTELEALEDAATHLRATTRDSDRPITTPKDFAAAVCGHALPELITMQALFEAKTCAQQYTENEVIIEQARNNNVSSAGYVNAFQTAIINAQLAGTAEVNANDAAAGIGDEADSSNSPDYTDQFLRQSGQEALRRAQAAAQKQLKALVGAGPSANMIDGIAAKSISSSLQFGMMDQFEQMQDELMSFAKIVVGQIQVMTAFVSGLEVDWPPLMYDLAASLAFINLDIISVGLPCMDSIYFFGSFPDILITSLTLPIVFAVLAFVISHALYLCGWVRDWYTTALSITLKLIFLCYPGCSAMAVKMFISDEIDGSRYLVADYRLAFGDEKWNAYSIAGIVGILVYPIGCPLLYFVLLYRNSHKLYSDRKIKERLGFICSRYEPEYYWCAAHPAACTHTTACMHAWLPAHSHAGMHTHAQISRCALSCLLQVGGRRNGSQVPPLWRCALLRARSLLTLCACVYKCVVLSLSGRSMHHPYLSPLHWQGRWRSWLLLYSLLHISSLPTSSASHSSMTQRTTCNRSPLSQACSL